MRFIRYEDNKQIHIGILKTDNNIVSLDNLLKPPITDMQEIVALSDKEISALENQVNQWSGTTKAMADVRVLTPIPNPKRNVFCLGKNYLEHAKELEGKTANLSGVPKFPIYFTKTASPAIGPEETIFYMNLLLKAR